MPRCFMGFVDRQQQIALGSVLQLDLQWPSTQSNTGSTLMHTSSPCELHYNVSHCFTFGNTNFIILMGYTNTRNTVWLWSKQNDYQAMFYWGFYWGMRIINQGCLYLIMSKIRKYLRGINLPQSCLRVADITVWIFFLFFLLSLKWHNFVQCFFLLCPVKWRIILSTCFLWLIWKSNPLHKNNKNKNSAVDWLPLVRTFVYHLSFTHWEWNIRTLGWFWAVQTLTGQFWAWQWLDLGSVRTTDSAIWRSVSLRLLGLKR